MNSIGRILRGIEQIFLYLSMGALLAMMLLVSLDATMRYFFARPLQFQFELTENYLMVMAILLPLAFITRERRHIAIDVFLASFPSLLTKPVRAVGVACMIALLAIVTYHSGLKAFEAFRLSETTFGVIDWPVGWSRIWVPLGCGLFMLRLAYDLVTGRIFEPGGGHEEHHQ